MLPLIKDDVLEVKDEMLNLYTGNWVIVPDSYVGQVVRQEGMYRRPSNSICRITYTRMKDCDFKCSEYEIIKRLDVNKFDEYHVRSVDLYKYLSKSLAHKIHQWCKDHNMYIPSTNQKRDTWHKGGPLMPDGYEYMLSGRITSDMECKCNCNQCTQCWKKVPKDYIGSDVSSYVATIFRRKSCGLSAILQSGESIQFNKCNDELILYVTRDINGKHHGRVNNITNKSKHEVAKLITKGLEDIRG
jgi:hypothetical protein